MKCLWIICFGIAIVSEGVNAGPFGIRAVIIIKVIYFIYSSLYIRIDYIIFILEKAADKERRKIDIHNIVWANFNSFLSNLDADQRHFLNIFWRIQNRYTNYILWWLNKKVILLNYNFTIHTVYEIAKGYVVNFYKLAKYIASSWRFLNPERELKAGTYYNNILLTKI